ncbi:2982_t:CDS:2, partial [Cetraspora pellucida]
DFKFYGIHCSFYYRIDDKKTENERENVKHISKDGGINIP